MRLFLDANIIVGVLNKEYPLFEYAAKVLSLADRQNTVVFVSPVSIAIAFYFASKKSGAEVAKAKISQLLDHVRVCDMNQEMTRNAVANARVLDLEDGIQYYSAVHHKCDYIVTENIQDFHFSSIPVMKPDDFLKEVEL